MPIFYCKITIAGLRARLIASTPAATRAPKGRAVRRRAAPDLHRRAFPFAAARPPLPAQSPTPPTATPCVHVWLSS